MVRNDARMGCEAVSRDGMRGPEKWGWAGQCRLELECKTRSGTGEADPQDLVSQCIWCLEAMR